MDDQPLHTPVTLDDYIEQHIAPEDEYLHKLYRSTQQHLLRPRMASGHLQGLLLQMLTEMIKPKKVLEIGTYSGYSALSMASGMTEDSELVTFEINDEQEDFTRPWLENSPYPPKIQFVIGDVFERLDGIPGSFDLVFIDANKRDYLRYYELVLPRIRKGGYLIADNTLWDGHVVDPSYDHDAQTCAIRKFNDHLARDPRVRPIILPIRDGLTIARVR